MSAGAIAVALKRRLPSALRMTCMTASRGAGDGMGGRVATTNAKTPNTNKQSAARSHLRRAFCLVRSSGGSSSPAPCACAKETRRRGTLASARQRTNIYGIAFRRADAITAVPGDGYHATPAARPHVQLLLFLRFPARGQRGLVIQGWGPLPCGVLRAHFGDGGWRGLARASSTSTAACCRR